MVQLLVVTAVNAARQLLNACLPFTDYKTLHRGVSYCIALL